MAINFPSSPANNQSYSFNGRTWTWNGIGWQATGSTGLTVYTKTNFTATAGQTSFSATYTVGFVDVYYNGSKLSTTEYTATSGTAVVLGTAAAVGDIIETIAWTISSSFNPSLGSASATSMAIGGATIGSNALAVTGSSSFPGSTSISSTGLVGIGMTPVNVLDITQSQNGLSLICFKNTNAGTASRSALQMTNGTTNAYLFLTGTGYTTASTDRQNGVRLYTDGAGGLTFETGTAQPIYFAVNSAEVARIGSDGSLLIGSTTNVGAGNMSAKSHIVRTTVAAVNGTSQITAVRTASVSTSATTIYAMGDYGYLFLITGDNGGAGFTDLVISGYGSSVTVISSTTAFGSPAARTYSNSSGNLQLAMASSTYNVAVISMQSGRY